MPRKRDGQGNPKPDPNDEGQWLWDLHRMDDFESRSLDTATLTTQKRLMDEPMNIFCGGSAHLPDGSLFVVGGHIDPNKPDDHPVAPHMHIYDPTRKIPWQMVMPKGKTDVRRWYPSVTGLPDGRMLITAGSREVLYGDPDKDNDETKGYWNVVNNDYEIYDPITKIIHSAEKDGRNVPFPDLIDAEAIKKGNPKA